ncbi:insulinase family protein [Nostocaceae cyanobacterium CENA369]|uniref:Insulinase family protein n=1 Tax=Dendronalium phyllosphericum CENA369 TaxID=1725256 RepID=A0A8J7LGK1_9NOST|nr:pitrilysin family protein [Dendronalium phyllosphericum]MBH8575233.1 insulinase family protein [Dendronalium phyllosphericum CENA369]
MFVSSVGYRYRFSLLLLTLWLIAVFLFGGKPANSNYAASSGGVNTQEKSIANNIKHLSLTQTVQKTVLENGLTVLIKEVHTAPVVSVQMWYKIGSRNEEPGVNGIAHQLEHMMFKGTKNRPIQFGQLFSALGSDSNAFTNYDQTAYYGTVERDKLKALLILEADRMQNALIDSEQLANEKRVVISELQGYENSPEYRLNRAVMRAVFPNHAYGLPIGGTKADVEKFQVEQVRKYYRNFYNPNNAVLTIVGDVQARQTLNTVKEIFGKIPKSQEAEGQRGRGAEEQRGRGAEEQRGRGAEEQRGRGAEEQRGRGAEGHRENFLLKTQYSQLSTQHSALSTPIVLREQGAAALLQVVYPLPNVNHPDIPALDVMDYVLTGGRNSHLYQALVDSGLASDITASVASLRESSWYELLMTANAESDLTKINSVLSDAIANLGKTGVKLEEVERAKTQLEAAVILSNRDLTSQAMQLGNDQTTAGDYRFTDRYLAAVRQVSAADVMKVLNKYLKPEVRTVGFFEPTFNQTKEVTNQPQLTKTTENLSVGPPPPPSEIAKYLPPVDKTINTIKTGLPQQFTLANGLQVLLLPDKTTPTVTLSGQIKAGTEFDPEDRAGLASLVADNLMSGTKTKDALTLAKTLEERGATLDFTARCEGMRIEGNSLAWDLPTLIQTLADVIKNSTFPEKELELNRQQALTSLKLELDDPTEVAKRIFIQSVYPKKHPLHTFPTEESLEQIKREDAIAFKAKHYRPDTTVLVLVGDFQPAKVRSLISKEFGNWQVSGQPPKLEYPTVSTPEKVVRVNPVLPGKVQAITYMGYTGINRRDPRFYATLVLNQILGGDTLSSRLGAEIRDRLGLSYGIYSYFQAQRNVGTFWIEMQTSPEDTNRAITSTNQLLQQIHQQGVTSLDVDMAKRTLISSYNVSLANPEELTNIILKNQVYEMDASEVRSFTQKIQQVTLAQVNQTARELLHPDRIVVVTAGPSLL